MNRRKHSEMGGLIVCAVVALMSVGAGGASAQSPDANVFLAVEGASWGTDQPALEVSDRHCRDLAYAAGMGDGRWRAYLDGSADDGEGDEIARERIGDGPFVNYHGVVVAESVAELHSDASRMSNETVTNAAGQGPVPSDFLMIPPGSELNAAEFSRGGPFLCFRVG